jgi:Ni/Co efflux regulator RcnB
MFLFAFLLLGGSRRTSGHHTLRGLRPRETVQAHDGPAVRKEPTMKSIAIACAIATAASGFSGAAFARDPFARDRDHDGRDDRAERREERREDRREQRREARRDWQRSHETVQAPGLAPHPRTTYRTQVQPAYSHRQVQPAYSYRQVQPAHSYQYVQPAQSYDYGYGNYGYGNYGYQYARPAYAVGGYVPYSYRQPTYYVNDWHAHNLYAPPYGHQWVRTDTGDFLLMALATGLIASLILSHR